MGRRTDCKAVVWSSARSGGTERRCSDERADGFCRVAAGAAGNRENPFGRCPGGGLRCARRRLRERNVSLSLEESPGGLVSKESMGDA